MDATTFDNLYAKEWHDKWFALMPPIWKPIAHKIQCLSIYVKNDFDMKNVNPDYVFAGFFNSAKLADFIEFCEDMCGNIQLFVIITNDDYICFFQYAIHFTSNNDIFGNTHMIAMSRNISTGWRFDDETLNIWNFAKSNPHIYIDSQTAYVTHKINCLQIASIHEFYTLQENVDGWQTWVPLEHIFYDEYLAKTIAKY